MQSGGKSHGESDSDLRSTLTVAELLIDNVIMSVINLIIIVTVQQQDTITQSLIDYFNVSKFCIKLVNSA